MWKSRKHESLWIIVVPERELFVFVVEPDWGPETTQRLSGERSRGEFSVTKSLRRDVVLKQLGAESPFSLHGRSREHGSVFAFEIHWSSGVHGVDYSNPLLRTGKLVLDASNVEKKEFGSMRSLREYYGVHGNGYSRGVCVCQNTEGLYAESTRKSLLQSLDTAADDETDTQLRSFSEKKILMEEPAQSSPSFEFKHTVGNEGSEVSSVHKSGERSGLRILSSFRKRRDKSLKNSSSSVSCGVGPRVELMFQEGMGENILPSVKTHVDVEQENEQEFDSVKTYSFRSITAEWTDVHVPCALLPVFEQDEHLLKMYESGLPTWAMFLPSYGFYYRPWLRSLTWILFYLFSIFSLTVGFWDLYKTLPGLQSALAKLVESMWLPPTAVLQWIEEHAQIRLSILLTYLFGKSEIWLLLMKNVSVWWKSLTVLFEPITSAIMPLTEFLQLAGQRTLHTAYQVAGSIIIPIVSILRGTFAFLLTPVSLAWQAGVHAWSGIVYLSSALSRAAAGISIGMSITQNSSSTGGWIMVSDAMRASLVKVLRASNSVWKFIVNVCNGISRHRITLSRRIRRWWQRLKSTLTAIIISLSWQFIEFFMRLYQQLPMKSGSRAVSEHSSDQSKDSMDDSAAAQASISFSNAFLSEEGLRHRPAAVYDDTASSVLKG
jgi:hypothetical protein